MSYIVSAISRELFVTRQLSTKKDRVDQVCSLQFYVPHTKSELAPFEAAVEAAAALVQENKDFQEMRAKSGRIEVRVGSSVLACGQINAGRIAGDHDQRWVVPLEPWNDSKCSLEWIGALEMYLGGVRLACTDAFTRLQILDPTDVLTGRVIGLMRCQIRDSSPVFGVKLLYWSFFVVSALRGNLSFS